MGKSWYDFRNFKAENERVLLDIKSAIIEHKASMYYVGDESTKYMTNEEIGAFLLFNHNGVKMWDFYRVKDFDMLDEVIRTMDMHYERVMFTTYERLLFMTDVEAASDMFDGCAVHKVNITGMNEWHEPVYNEPEFLGFLPGNYPYED